MSGAAFSVHTGRLSQALDAFDHPCWDEVRRSVAGKSADMRNQGFSGSAMPMGKLEHTGVMTNVEALEKRFKVRA